MSAWPGLVGENCCLSLLCFLMNCFGKRARDNQELGWGRKSVVTLSSTFVSLKDANLK